MKEANKDMPTVNTELLQEKEQIMRWGQIAENWNGQVGKLYNWSIKRLAGAADRTDCRLPSIKARKHAGREEYHEIQHEGPDGRQVS